MTLEPVPLNFYQRLFTYAHLADVAYCIDEVHKLLRPFGCSLQCDKLDLRLRAQWLDTVAGYVAVGHLFEKRVKTVVVALRGTRSVGDSFRDARVGMVAFVPLGLPECRGCRVHKGFYAAFESVVAHVGATVAAELEGEYELLVVGHSYGGAVAHLLGLHFLAQGHRNVRVVTLGQPLLGNANFVEWADGVYGSHLPVDLLSFDRRLYRVVHKADIVASLPTRGKWDETYAQFANQVYLNVTSKVEPRQDQVLDCGTDERCLASDETRPLWLLVLTNYLENHTTYFRRMGRCGLDEFGLFLGREVSLATLPPSLQGTAALLEKRLRARRKTNPSWTQSATRQARMGRHIY